MATYEFSRLSAYDFEELARDLLQEEWSVRLEAFTAGRDGGIDLRCLHKPEGTVIVQCKHMPGAAFGDLRSQLRRFELPKVQKLAPFRYVIVTSAGLTPANKSELAVLFAPHVLSQSDIFGRSDIENLLRLHPNIETRNFKLWLTSTAVLQRVLHNAEKCQTDFEVDRVYRKLNLFVQNSAFPRAQAILDETRIVVISGVPGIGKTTLADMLLYSHLEQGYTPVVVTNQIAEAKRLFDRNKKQIFYFDDFLGQTFLQDRSDLQGINSDAALVTFMDAVAGTPHSRFILTTREYILRSALQFSERLSRSDILNHKCILELHDYSFSQKARILYNHLYFSRLPRSYKDAILENEFYLDIIRHRGFNPRIIDWLSDFVRVRTVEPSNYKTHILELLSSPTSIWKHAFEFQISEGARSFLLTLCSLGSYSEVIDVTAAWETLHRHRARKYNFATSASDLNRAMDELEGSFIENRGEHVSFINPSVSDFMESVIAASADSLRDLVASAVKFNQLRHLFDFAQKKPGDALQTIVSQCPPDFRAALERVLLGETMRWKTEPDGRKTGTYIDAHLEHRLIFLISRAEELKSQSLMALTVRLVDFLKSAWGRNAVDINATLQAVRAFEGTSWVMTHGGSDIRRMLLDAVFEDIRLARHYEWDQIIKYNNDSPMLDDRDKQRIEEALELYLKEDVHEERQSCDNASELNELREGLVELRKEYGLNLDSVIASIEDDLANQPERDGDDEGYRPRENYVPPRVHEPLNESEIRNIFSTLVE